MTLPEILEAIMMGEQALLLGGIGVVVALRKKLHKAATEAVDRIIKAAMGEIKDEWLAQFRSDIAEIKEAIEGLQEHDAEAEKLHLAQIRDRVAMAHGHFVKKGSIDRYTLSSLCEIFEWYVARAENTFVGEHIADLKKLPVQ